MGGRTDFGLVGDVLPLALQRRGGARRGGGDGKGRVIAAWAGRRHRPGKEGLRQLEDEDEVVATGRTMGREWGVSGREHNGIILCRGGRDARRVGGGEGRESEQRAGERDSSEWRERHHQKTPAWELSQP